MAVSLSKGQTIDLSKHSSGLSRVRMGLGWDPVKKGGFLSGIFGGGNDSIDLDASCILFDAANNKVDEVWFRQLTSRDGSIRHSGDNLTGEGSGDDEVINVDLSRLSPNVTALVFAVNSFRGQSFNEVDNAFCRLVDESNGQEICRFDLKDRGSHTGVIMAVVSRATGAWTMKAVGSPASGRTFQDLVPDAVKAI